ncbi:MAG: GNAT family N-acetyltransferase [Bacteroidota bacterium]|nr:GNAT family N-acetyltransferase [Bacteroidota bacterium]MDP3145793.1 GNAT family N-acetyltransferase [Bacteroidota bacterium]MDP3558427.1 GNAT family N-acetyltransferase [Bacteroidota bacterium]
MEFILKNFNQLSIKQLFEIYKLRSEVFVVEQNCAYQDIDEVDMKAKHLMLFENDILTAYTRIIPPGITYKEPAIGRVVVKKSYRGKDLGKLLMQQSIDVMKDSFKNLDILLSAQSHLVKFYTDLGFKAEGQEYLEDDIPHTKMRLKA